MKSDIYIYIYIYIYKQDEILEKDEGRNHELADRMTKLENINYDLKNENCELKENFLQLKTHSIKYNLIFSGIQQTDHENENTEAVLKHFIHTELEMLRTLSFITSTICVTDLMRNLAPLLLNLQNIAITCG